MTRPIRSVRLLKRSARSLDVLSGSPGEIFFDETNGSLRVYTGAAGEKIILATRAWVNTNTGDYTSLTNKPVLATVATSGSYTDLINTPADTYTPSVASDWTDPAPTTIVEAIDRLAALTATLNSGVGA